jgi:hypothetical protein
MAAHIIHKLCYGERQSIFASFSEGIQPSSEAKAARFDIHVTLGLPKSLQCFVFRLGCP